MTVANKIQCNVVTPERSLLDEPVEYASIPAWDGQIGIADLRAPLLVKLGDGILRLDYAGGSSRSFFIGGGFAQVKDNRLSILTTEAVEKTEVNVTETRAALKEAEARKALTDEEVARRDREVKRAKTMLQLVNA
jgi:F-type H+-transporting ATPase subunit epsilon